MAWQRMASDPTKSREMGFLTTDLAKSKWTCLISNSVKTGCHSRQAYVDCVECPRRCGKSCLCFLTMQAVLPETVVFGEFNDEYMSKNSK